MFRCRNTLLGGATNRGVSGGELKRVNVANELLVNPSLFLLDEPTSGLDSTSAMSLVSNLVEIASNANRSVAMSVHQPSSQVNYFFPFLGGGDALSCGRCLLCSTGWSCLPMDPLCIKENLTTPMTTLRPLASKSVAVCYIFSPPCRLCVSKRIQHC